MEYFDNDSILNEWAERRKRKWIEKHKANRTNLRKGGMAHSPSHAIGDAKVQINSETAKQNLKIIAEKYKNTTDVRGFLTDLRIAIGLPNGTGASKYGVISIPKDDGNILYVTLRLSNHSANAITYLAHSKTDYNLSIVVQRKRRRNTFNPDASVIMDEYVYTGNRIQNIDSPLSKIALSLADFLDTGVYTDTTGVAIKHVSPQPTEQIKTENNIKENKQYTHMRKNVVRLNESQIRQIVRESMRKVLNEKHNSHTYQPIGSHKFWTDNGSVEWTSIVTLQCPSSGQCCHIAEDDGCYVLFNGHGLKDKNCEHLKYIFREAFETLKSLPTL